MAENDSNAQFGNTILSARIDAQLEAYRIITTDYNNILASLDKLRTEIESLQKIQGGECRDAAADLKKVTNLIEVHTENAGMMIKVIKDSIEKQQTDVGKIVGNLETYQRNLDSTIKNLIDELSKVEKNNDTDIDASIVKLQDVVKNIEIDLAKQLKDGFDCVAKSFTDLGEVPSVLKILQEELIRKKNRLRTKFYYIVGTLAVVVAIFETLTQLGIIKIDWFAK
jgi:hypothetical protein